MCGPKLEINYTKCIKKHDENVKLLRSKPKINLRNSNFLSLRKVYKQFLIFIRIHLYS